MYTPPPKLCHSHQSFLALFYIRFTFFSSCSYPTPPRPPTPCQLLNFVCLFLYKPHPYFPPFQIISLTSYPDFCKLLPASLSPGMPDMEDPRQSKRANQGPRVSDERMSSGLSLGISIKTFHARLQHLTPSRTRSFKKLSKHCRPDKLVWPMVYTSSFPTSGPAPGLGTREGVGVGVG